MKILCILEKLAHTQICTFSNVENNMKWPDIYEHINIYAYV